MKLNTILESIKPLSISPRSDPEIKGLAYDSRQVKPGYIFFALKGQRQDGQLFIQDAVDRGAEVIVSEQACHASRAASFVGMGQTVILQVADARESMAQIARVFYRNPSA
ncbi:MAG: Mur ligase domain-containing protein, partial [Kiritimatiellia bacterium]|nr:Mur ligase domain-containing protein [Kiritimatiellia bacterium]